MKKQKVRQDSECHKKQHRKKKMKVLTPSEERILKKAHDISERKREDSRRLTEKWIQQEFEQAKKERNRGTKERSDSESSRDDPRKGKRKKRPRINMIRATPTKEVVLTPAPGWQEAVGRPEMRGEDDTTEGGIREVEGELVPRRRNEGRDEEGRREIPVILDREAIRDAEDGIIQGRYAFEARERIPGPRPKTEEEHARSTVRYFDHLKWQLSRITTGSRNRRSGKDAKILQEFNSMKKKKKEEPTEQR
jgi:hypothetical protein